MSAEMLVHLHVVNCIFFILCLYHLQKFPDKTQLQVPNTDLKCVLSFVLFFNGTKVEEGIHDSFLNSFVRSGQNITYENKSFQFY